MNIACVPVHFSVICLLSCLMLYLHCMPLEANPFQYATSTLPPALFSPPVHRFPAWNVEGALNTSAVLCYGGDKAHLFSVHKKEQAGSGGGMSGKNAFSRDKASCFNLGNGPATLLWDPMTAANASTSGSQRSGSAAEGAVGALVAGPASAFHLNYNTRTAKRAPPSPLPPSPPPPPPPGDLCEAHMGTDYVLRPAARAQRQQSRRLLRSL